MSKVWQHFCSLYSKDLTLLGTFVTFRNLTFEQIPDQNINSTLFRISAQNISTGKCKKPKDAFNCIVQKETHQRFATRIAISHNSEFDILTFLQSLPFKGQLISKCPFGVKTSSKKPTKLFPGFCPEFFFYLPWGFLEAFWGFLQASLFKILLTKSP